jgi:hypothetical protein
MRRGCFRFSGRNAAAATNTGAQSVSRGALGWGVIVGAVLDEEHRLIGQEVPAIFDGESPREVLPLAGFALPYEDLQFQECHVMPPAYCLSERYREAVQAGRVAGRVVPEHGGA